MRNLRDEWYDHPGFYCLILQTMHQESNVQPPEFRELNQSLWLKAQLRVQQRELCRLPPRHLEAQCVSANYCRSRGETQVANSNSDRLNRENQFWGD